MVETLRGETGELGGSVKFQSVINFGFLRNIPVHHVSGILGVNQFEATFLGCKRGKTTKNVIQQPKFVQAIVVVILGSLPKIT